MGGGKNKEKKIKHSQSICLKRHRGIGIKVFGSYPPLHVRM